MNKTVLFSVLAVFMVVAGCRGMQFGAQDNISIKGDVNPLWLETMLEAGPRSQDAGGSTGTDTVVQHSAPSQIVPDISYDRVSGTLSDQPDRLSPLAAVSSPSDTFTGSTESQTRKAAKSLSQGLPLPVQITINNASTPDKAAFDPSMLAGLKLPGKQKLSRVEKLYNETGGLTQGMELEQYGYSFFERMAESQVTSTVDPEYVIGPGDEIILRVSGGVEIEKVLEVGRDGNVFVQSLGAFHVAGIRAGNLTETIRSAVGKEFSDFQINATLGRLHAIRIQVSGFVKKPGLLKIPANSTLVEALSLAGGPTKNGSLRRIKLFRAGQKERVIDLYGLIRSGDTARDDVLISGDTVQVEPIGATAAVIGPLESGIYEIIDKTTVKRLAQTAGDVNSFTLRQTVLLERTSSQGQRRLYGLSYDADSNKRIADADVLAFFRIDEDVSNTVQIIGSVVRSGVYPYFEGMKVSDLLKLGGGFLLEASLEKAVIQRQLGRTAAFDIIPGDAAGRVRHEVIWVDIAKLLNGNTEHDITLERLDRLRILTHTDVQNVPTIDIYGAVRRPGTYSLSAGMTLSSIIRLAGGLAENAYLGQGTIVRRRTAKDGAQLDIETIVFDTQKAVSGGAEADIVLANKDSIEIRQIQKMQVRVSVQGRVQFPGTYILPDGSTVADLMTYAGGLIDGADLRAAVFTRESVRRIQQIRLEEMFAKSQERFAHNRNMLVRSGGSGESLAGQLSMLGLERLAQNMKRFQARGRIVMNINEHDFTSSEQNLTLENNDRLFIPQRNSTVIVMGRVFSPNAFVWQPEWTVEDYLEKTGGLLSDADEDEVYVILAGGDVRSAAQKKGASALMAFKPGPGDTVLVPAKPIERSAMSSISDTLGVLREIAEIGLIGAAVPQAGKTPINFAADIGKDPFAGKGLSPEVYRQMLSAEQR